VSEEAVATGASDALDELRSISRVAESLLSDEIAAGLPESAPPAPWAADVEGVFWFHRSRLTAPTAVSAPLRAGLPLAVGAFLHYPRGPVGAYNEILCSPTLVHGRRGVCLHVPFIAVDSPASVRGGRANWALPKVLAQFSGSPAEDREVRVEGAGWWVRVRMRPLRAPSIPFLSRAHLAQVFPDATTRTALFTSRGRARLALVDLEVDPNSSLGGLIKPGRHLGAIVRGSGYIGVAEPASRA
jgi:hypothetical protein